MELSDAERAMAAGHQGEGVAIAMRIVVETGRLLGADRLIPIASAHIDGCLYHGDSGVLFAEKLAGAGARVAVPSTLNVGALDLLHTDLVRLPAHQRTMAQRLMRAYETLGCRPTWTCSPYQAGHRPVAGTDVAWGESNAVAFCNSVLGARTNRYGDFLDIACAIAGRAPRYGLHVPANRRARLLLDATGLPQRLMQLDAFWPVLGALLGRHAGEQVAVIDGAAAGATEDRLKALGAAAASFGAVGLFHVAGRTPEAATVTAACQGDAPAETIRLRADMIREARGWLSTTTGETVDAIAVGSPHLSADELVAIARLLAGRRVTRPFYAHTGRHAMAAIRADGTAAALEQAGVTIVTDTCIVVTPILPGPSGVLLTSSGKFANYAPGNTGWAVLYGSLAECVESAVAGRLVRDEEAWS